MRALVRDRYGPPDTLRIEDVPLPEPGPGEVRVRVRACGLNGSDAEFVTGRPAYARIYGLTVPRFRVLGSDISGEVEALGPGVTDLAVGQTVIGDIFEHWGGLAEVVVVPAKLLLPKPEHLSFAEAAALPQSLQIAVAGTVDRGVSAGQRVLINGAGGSGGVFAIQLAARAGAEVTAADSAAKQGLMQELGASRVLDYAKTDFASLGETWDLILDFFNTRSATRIAACLAPGGRYLTVGGPVGPLLSIVVLGGLRSLFGSRKLGLLAVRQGPELLAGALRVLDPPLTIPIDGPHPLSSAPEVFARLVAGEIRGKAVIVP